MVNKYKSPGPHGFWDPLIHHHQLLHPASPIYSKMQYLSTLLILASSASILAAPTTTSNPPGLDFTPGLKIPAVCHTTENRNECPAKLDSKWALLTSLSITLHEIDGGTKAAFNALRAGFSFNGQAGKGHVIEESTITLFDFPSGQEKRECRFQFVSDEGDNVPGAPDSPNIYNVWSLVPQSGVIGEGSTWWNKPSRDLVVATFTANQLREGVETTTSNDKYLHTFLFGPGYKTPMNGKTFPCPAGGKLAYEVAAAIKSPVENGGINIGGHNSLGIEIIGLKSEWYN